MQKLAILAGIDHYQNARLSLDGCVQDAEEMRQVLARNDDGSPNFECELLTTTDANVPSVTRGVLRKRVADLFSRPTDVAVFYFSGHGARRDEGGFLVTQDASSDEPGLPMADVLTLANKSPARERIVILDCCDSGTMGGNPLLSDDKALLAEGVTLLCGTRGTQKALERVFTSLILDALRGGAADVCGRVTIAGTYAYVDQLLGGFDQRPVFKSHVSKLVTLRECRPAIDISLIRELHKHFPSSSYLFPLDPSFESSSPEADPAKSALFRRLQRLTSARLVEPVGEEHMYYAAMNSKACRLTPLGVFYRELAAKGKI